ncbi:DEKNAAC102897 [Brettanomyces naardenensis]|uniref:High osmolarity signaling protein SHO1 n=1 Tax=Brettanomyces naardenensis TaxID=13370 RepID=A0A448YM30_BRENA|nr:DEKNAAC102897 [Brettanomyces naardenensis]
MTLTDTEGLKAMNFFALSSYVMAFIAWIIAFAGSIASSVSLNDYYPKFSWWALVFQLILLVLLPILYATNSIHFHRMFLVACLSVAFVYNSNSTNNLVYYSGSSTAAASAGFIVSSMINFLWILYFGSDPNSPAVALLDSFGDGENLLVRSRRLAGNKNGRPVITRTGAAAAPGVTASNSFTVAGGNDAISGKENGNPFEAVEPYTQELSGFENPAQPEDAENHTVSNVNNRDTVLPDADYPILVKGLYDYAASPDDINELSFKKGEVFKVKDTTGNWWQGKNSKGDIGMCPSNYLEVI